MSCDEKLIPQNVRTPLESVVPLKAPYVIFIDPSGACNFNCSFCPCNNSDYMNEERHTVMSLDLFKKIIDDISSFEEQVKVIYLHGFGEPLMNKNIPEMVKYIKEKKACREVRLTTNGSLLNPTLNRKLVDAGIDLIRISIEALDSEAYKKICGIDADFESIVKNVQDLYTYSNGKTKVSAKIVNVALKNNEDRRKFYEIFSPITDYHFIEEVEEYWPKFKVELNKENIKANKLYYDTINEVTICTAPLVEMTIYSNGMVGVCAADWKFHHCYGNANTESIKDLWNSEKLKKFQLLHLTKKRNDINYCNECKYRPVDNIDGVADIITKRLLNQ